MARLDTPAVRSRSAGNRRRNAGSGANTLTISDSGSTIARTATITDHSIVGLAPAAITYAATGGSFAGGITISGGTGGNTITVASTNQTANVRTITLLSSGQGNDIVAVTDTVPSFLVIDAQGGNDLVNASSATLPVTIFGGAGNDTITGGSAADVIFGDAGRIRFASGAGTVLGGLPGEAFIANPALGDAPATIEAITIASEGNDSVNGGGGNDTVIGGGGGDVLHGDAGNDVILGDSGELDYTNGDLRTITSTASGVGGNDTITGDDGNDIVIGGGGDDTISGGTGDDLLIGDEDPITLVNGVLVQVQSSNTSTGGVDTISGDGGDDTIIGGFGADELHGNAGNDLILGDSGQLDYVKGDLRTVQTIGSGIGGADTITGDDARDVNAATDSTIGAGGNDTILGGAAGDTIRGNGGNDLILGDSGELDYTDGDLRTIASTASGIGCADTITGDDGSDSVIGGAGNDTISGNAGDDLTLGDEGRITLISGVRQVVVSTNEGVGGADTITGDDGNDSIIGGAAGDSIQGGTGADVILGDSGRLDYVGGDLRTITTTAPSIGGNDTITTADGGDIILGGAGDDTITAGGRGVILTDNGFVTLVNGVITQIAPTDPTVTGVNVIVASGGNDTLLGGPGNDRITETGGGNNVILGDGGIITFVNGVISVATTNDPSVGGNDTIVGGSGNDTIVGGAGNDVITDAQGNNVIVGDNGRVDFTVVGTTSRMVRIQTTDPAYGGNDTITGGTGNDVIIGGAGSNTLAGAGGHNIMIGNNAAVTPAWNGDPATAGATPKLNADGMWHMDVVLLDAGTVTGSYRLGAAVSNAGATIQDLDSTDIVLVTGDIAGGVHHLNADGTWDTRLLQVKLIADGPNLMTAGDGNNAMYGGRGNDTLTAGNGNNTLVGGSGNDTLRVGNGSDTLVGDTATVWSGVVPTGKLGDKVWKDYSDHAVDKDDAVDQIVDSNDTLVGGTGTNLLVGGAASKSAINLTFAIDVAKTDADKVRPQAREMTTGMSALGSPDLDIKAVDVYTPKNTSKSTTIVRGDEREAFKNGNAAKVIINWTDMFSGFGSAPGTQVPNKWAAMFEEVPEDHGEGHDALFVLSPTK